MSRRSAKMVEETSGLDIEQFSMAELDTPISQRQSNSNNKESFSNKLFFEKDLFDTSPKQSTSKSPPKHKKDLDPIPEPPNPDNPLNSFSIQQCHNEIYLEIKAGSDDFFENIKNCLIGLKPYKENNKETEAKISNIVDQLEQDMEETFNEGLDMLELYYDQCLENHAKEEDADEYLQLEQELENPSYILDRLGLIKEFLEQEGDEIKEERFKRLFEHFEGRYNRKIEETLTNDGFAKESNNSSLDKIISDSLKFEKMAQKQSLDLLEMEQKSIYFDEELEDVKSKLEAILSQDGEGEGY